MCRKYGFVMVAAVLVVVLAATTGFAGKQEVKPFQVLRPSHFGVTPPVSELTAQQPAVGVENYEIPNPEEYELPVLPGAQAPDQVMGEGFISPDSGVLAPSPIIGFDGNNSDDNQAIIGFRLAPPDTQGAVGIQYYVQWVNLTWTIYDKSSGAAAVGPLAGNSLWAAGIPGTDCANFNNGDPITLFDHGAQRWFMSQFALDGAQYRTCLAVSVTSDPTGSWYVWQYTYGSLMNDYPKFGVWPDGYYMTVNEFGSGQSATTVFDRTAMLAGDPNPAAQYFYIEPVQPAFPQPTNWDGGPPPPAGAPNYNAAFYDDAWGNPADIIQICEFHVDWTTPANSTFTCPGGPGDPGYIDLTAIGLSFDSNLCGGSRACIPQPNGQTVDALANRFMFPLNYRNLMSTLGYEVMTVTHSVDVDGSDHAGMRWYELRNTGSGWFVADGGTFAPDSDNRWMGSSAVDQNGNIGIVYSISSSSTFPSVGYTGRLVGDPPGTMQTEQVLVAGGGSMSDGANRWGDYAAMHMDPDGCTFWGTAEYVNTGGSWIWDTYVGAFSMPGCTPTGFGTVDGTVYNSVTMTPIDGALVEVGPYTTYTEADGSYGINVPSDTYDVTASAFGFAPMTANGVVVTDGNTTTQDFALDPVGSAFLDGYVTSNLQGWPLYAMIDIATGGGTVATVYTNPFNGYYEIELPQGTAYDLTVTSLIAGYDPAMRGIVLGPAGQTESFVLADDGSQPWSRCILDGGVVEDFEGDFPPGGWVSVDNIGSGHVWMRNDEIPSANRTGGDGYDAAADSDATCGSGPWDTTLYSPFVVLPASPNKGIRFQSNFQDFAGDGQAWFDVSPDGGSSWTNLGYYDTDDPGGTTGGGVLREFDLSAYAGMTVQFRWRYTDDGSGCAWFWHIDNVSTYELGGGGATFPPPGWSVVDNIGSGNNWNTNAYFGASNNITGGSGLCADADSDATCGGGAWDATMYSSPVDLSGTTNPVVSFLSNFQDFAGSGQAWFDISNDGGSNWTNLIWLDVDDPAGGQPRSMSLEPYIGDTVMFRWRYSDDGDGCAWYWRIDDVSVDDGATNLLFETFDPLPPPPEPDPTLICETVPGALVEGFVSDANLGDGLNGADVTDDIGGATTTMATPEDPNIPDGFYYMFTPMDLGEGPATRTFTASAPKYADSVVVTNPVPDTVNRLDFSLAAGWLEMTPHDMASRLYAGMTEDHAMDILNWGTLEANVGIHVTPIAPTWPHHAPVFDTENLPGNKAPKSTGRAAHAPSSVQPASSPDRMLAGPPAFGMNLYPGADLEFWSDLEVPGSWTGISGGMGAFFAGDFLNGDFSKEYVLDYDTNSLLTVDTTTGAITMIGPAPTTGGESWTGLTAAGDGTMYASGTTCAGSTLYTIDPATGTPTVVGQITNADCIIDIAINAAGELYGVDIVGDNLLQIDPSTGAGTIIGSLGVSANYAQGMDFDEVSGTLYWAAYTTSGELRVIDTATGASTLVGAFPGGAEVCALGVATYAGGGGLPWLVITPDEGVVPPMSGDPGDMPANAQFIADGADHYGLFRANVWMSHDTPYDVNDMQVCFTKAFNDVAPTFWADDYIHSLAGARISQGCGGGDFCGKELMIRNVMARWLVKTYYGPDFQPMLCAGTFTDVVCDQTPNSNYIEQIYADGITTGCSTDPLKFCPDDPVNRAQMATFITRLAYGPEFVPPAPTGMVFSDVQQGMPGWWAAGYIEWLASEGVVEGYPDGTYQPLTNTTRAQMSKMVVISVGLPMCDMDD